MARLPTQKRITVEGFPDEVRKWIPKLLEPLNRFMEEINRALNRNLTLNENMAAQIRTVVVDGTFPQKFSWDLTAKPIAATIGQCRELDENHTTFASPLYLDWEYTADGMIQINDVVNLSASASSKYNLTMMIFTG